MSTEQMVQYTVRVNATPKATWRYFTDAQLMKKWQGTEVALDPRPEGVYRVDVNGRDIATGEFLDVVPFERIAFSFGWENSDQVPPSSSKVMVHFTSDGSGTLVDLTHAGLPNNEQAKAHQEGWMHYLERMAIVAGGGDPGPDPWSA